MGVSCIQLSEIPKTDPDPAYVQFKSPIQSYDLTSDISSSSLSPSVFDALSPRSRCAVVVALDVLDALCPRARRLRQPRETRLLAGCVRHTLRLTV